MIADSADRRTETLVDLGDGRQVLVGTAHPTRRRETVVVVGHGMVGHRFCEKLVELDAPRRFQIVTFCEEPRPAYDRVNLTGYFAHRRADQLQLADPRWYEQQGIHLHVGDRVTEIDRERKVVRSLRGREVAYDHVVLATGSFPFVPEVPGVDKRGVFVYRTIDDLEKIAGYRGRARRAIVVGGGLLGLEAAKAAYDLGLETHVVELAPRLMPRQIDEAGSKVLVEKIAALGVQVHLNKASQEVLGNGKVEAVRFADGSELAADMLIFSAGIRPRDELARRCGLEVSPRGGVVVDDRLQTSDQQIFAIGEVALHQGMIYGLVAPGYEMAEVVAANLAGRPGSFSGADLSTKLKLMGVDVASFGSPLADAPAARSIVLDDPLTGVYKRLVVSGDGRHLLGGILVGDASDYGRLLMLYRSGQPLTAPPAELLLGRASGDAAAASAGAPPSEAQVCSCNNVSGRQICDAIRQQQLTAIDQVKACTRAGTGCGGCLPQVADLLKAELRAAGQAVQNHLCEHFAYSRQELYHIVKIKQLKTFDALLASHGRGHGCEICKPAVASILASLWNESVLQHSTLQDTNDRFLANLQRGGLYSVVPRVPGGEITPDKLIVLGQVAKKYGLYTKITGGQRVDLFGAPVHRLPDIWEELIEAGFESGHAYGKAVRTVKSCVGSTWCRYGIGDSVGFAIRIELRYRGIRAPHKIKAAVSGCIRECAEAQSKDFGLIATESGYNLYVCGNGGARPRHADLLAADLDEETCLKYIDRFLMYYIQTADRLTRTSVWLEKMEGGIDYLRDVIIHDRLGICDELERQMQFLVESYRCEWKEVVDDPDKRRLFRQFVNTEETEPGIEMVAERDQRRPADWPRDFVPLESLALPVVEAGDPPPPAEDRQWVKVGAASDFPQDGGATVKYGRSQLAVFHFAGRGRWFATQNMCPHKQAFVLSQAIVGDQQGISKIACPLHKKTFSLETGKCLSGEDYSIETFPVKVEGGAVYVQLPPCEQLDARLATQKFCRSRCAAADVQSPLRPQALST